MVSSAAAATSLLIDTTTMHHKPSHRHFFEVINHINAPIHFLNLLRHFHKKLTDHKPALTMGAKSLQTMRENIFRAPASKHDDAACALLDAGAPCSLRQLFCLLGAHYRARTLKWKFCTCALNETIRTWRGLTCTDSKSDTMRVSCTA